MKRYVLVVGLDKAEIEQIRETLEQPVLSHVIIPRIRVIDGDLFAETGRGIQMVPISTVIYHGIYENDLDFITGLGFWAGPCLPNPRGMMDLRLKLPGLLRALDHSQFGHARGFLSPHTTIRPDNNEYVAKWGNWHCGENKQHITSAWTSEAPSVIEPFFAGEAVRVVIIGDKHWQIRLEGDTWLKSIHHEQADFMDVDTELLEDTQNIRSAFGLEIIANDYIVAEDGNKCLLEVNHIPNVTHFPQLWDAYLELVAKWVAQQHTIAQAD